MSMPGWSPAAAGGLFRNSALGSESEEPETLLFDSEPIVAWRAWLVNSDKQALRSATYAIKWPKRKPMHAHCLTAFFKVGKDLYAANPHVCPCLHHSCGVYAVLDESAARIWVGGVGAVVGRVALWGRVLRFEKGYRAEYAYPIDLLDNPLLDIERIAAAYGVPMIAH